MTSNLSKTQIDKLGDRLRKGDITEADLRMLDEYRLLFSDAYEYVVETIRNRLGVEPTGRPAKSTGAIREKLKRETIRLSQIQDIAGCRLVVEGIVEQEQLVDDLRSVFDDATLVDRREQPSHGYRAVHMVVVRDNKVVEIQVRTALQHLWAEWSEKLSDIVDPGIKYGVGNENLLQLLFRGSRLVASAESLEIRVADDERRGVRLITLAEGRRISVEEWKKNQTEIKKELLQFLLDVIEESPSLSRSL